MKSCCLINNHNYRHFVGDAIESALAQTRPFDEIIVIDDGSTDGSQHFLQAAYGGHRRIRIVAKDQGGQLSCFNLGSQLVDADIVFFLDADDRFSSDYAATAVELYESRPDIEFLTVNRRFFGGETKKRDREIVTRDRGLSVLATLFRKTWVGMPTSCVSMRTDLLKSVAIYPNEADWQTRADDVLIFGTSILGARKFHLAEPLVDYRIHETNHFARKRFSAAEKMQYALRVNRMMAWYAQRMGYDRQALAYLIHREFRTWERPSYKELLRYVGMLSRARLPLLNRCEQGLTMLGHYIAEQFRKTDRDATATQPSNVEVGPAETTLRRAA